MNRTISTTILLLCSASSYPSEPAEAWQEVCELTLAQYVSDSDTKRPQYIPRPQTITSNTAVELYPYHGKSVPLLPYYDDWYFAFVHGSSIIAREEPSISYHMGKSMEVAMVLWALEILEEIGIEPEDPDPFELIERALLFEPTPDVCALSDVDELRTVIVSIYVKRSAFSDYDTVYWHNDGFLGVRENLHSKVWAYVFTALQGEHREIRIYNGTAGEFQNIGFEIRDFDRPSTPVTPMWIHAFFDAANQPDELQLEKLRQAVGDYPLPDKSLQSMREYLQSIESEPPE